MLLQGRGCLIKCTTSGDPDRPYGLLGVPTGCTMQYDVICYTMLYDIRDRFSDSTDGLSPVSVNAKISKPMSSACKISSLAKTPWTL